MTRCKAMRDVFAEMCGISNEKLDMMLDMYAAAVLLDEQDAEPVSLPAMPTTGSEIFVEIPPGKAKIIETIPVQSAESNKPGPKAGTGAGAAGREVAALKRSTHARLTAYREKNGVDCYARLTEITHGAITEDDLRMMANSGKMPAAKWKLLAAALDKAEADE